jgi:hypothetical protein
VFDVVVWQTLPHLRYEEGWTYDGNDAKEKDKILMVEFDVVITEFLKLKPIYQEAIADICKQMGAGMAEFAEKDGCTGTETKEEYNLYCHYVAGLVGVGPATIFISLSSFFLGCPLLFCCGRQPRQIVPSAAEWCAIVHPFRPAGFAVVPS